MSPQKKSPKAKAKKSKVTTPSGIEIANNDAIPDEHHVTRYVSWSKVARDKDGNASGVLWKAFALRPDETSLSASWNEFYSGTASAQFGGAVAQYREKFDVKPKDVFAVSRIEKIKELGRAHKQNIRVYFSPSSFLPSHASISRLGEGGQALSEALAVEGVEFWRQNSKIP